MRKVVTWDKFLQAYYAVFHGSRQECEEYIFTKRTIGDRTTYLNVSDEWEGSSV